jgi:hypothetical protein
VLRKKAEGRQKGGTKAKGRKNKKAEGRQKEGKIKRH